MNESWNPEPPPEIANIERSDLIDGTLFSKHSVFELLLKLINKLNETTTNDQPGDSDNATGNSNGNAEDMNSKNADRYKELDAQLEQDMCDLWDMTVERSVCAFLDEHNCVPIFEGFLRRFGDCYPRAVEILVGILVNMATLSEHVALKVTESRDLLEFLLLDVFYKMTDVQAMVQVVSLVNVLFSAADSNRSADEAQKRKLAVRNLIEFVTEPLTVTIIHKIVEKTSFVLEQSLNTQLLDATCALLLNLLYSNDTVLETIATTNGANLVECVCSGAQTRIYLDQAGKSFTSEAYSTAREVTNGGESSSLAAGETPRIKLNTQISEEDMNQIDHLFNKYFLCLQTLSTCEAGVRALSESCVHVLRLLDTYLDKTLANLNAWEVKSTQASKLDVGDESVRNVTCVMSVVGSILASFDGDENVGSDDSVLLEMADRYNKLFVKLFTFCLYYLRFFGERKRMPQQEDAEERAERDEELVGFDEAKRAIDDVLAVAVRMRTENDVVLNKLVDDCVRLANAY